MWIATHKGSEGFNKYHIISILSTSSDEKGNPRLHYICDRGITGDMRPTYLKAHYKPIKITCPYCHASINQSERIECECGFSAIAIPLMMITHVFNQYDIIKGMDMDTDCGEYPTYLKYGIGDANSAGFKVYITVRLINELYWLEITGGNKNDD